MKTELLIRRALAQAAEAWRLWLRTDDIRHLSRHRRLTKRARRLARDARTNTP